MGVYEINQLSKIIVEQSGEFFRARWAALGQALGQRRKTGDVRKEDRRLETFCLRPGERRRMSGEAADTESRNVADDCFQERRHAEEIISLGRAAAATHLLLIGAMKTGRSDDAARPGGMRLDQYQRYRTL